MRRHAALARSWIPHAVTFSRLPLAVLFALAFGTGEPGRLLAAAAVIGVSALSDYLDGALARRWDTVSTFGKWADPLSDALFFLAVYLSFLRAGLMSPLLFALFVAREVLQYGLLRPIGARLRIDQGARPAGKLKTALQTVGSAVVVLMRLAVVSGSLSPAVASVATTALLIALVAVSLASLYWYVIPLLRLRADDRAIAGIGGTAACHFAANLGACSLAHRLWVGAGALPAAFVATLGAWSAVTAAFLVWRRRDLDSGAGAELVNLPCQITLVRLFSVPAFAYLIAAVREPRAGPVLLGSLALVFLTDLADGRVARATGAATAMGKYLDPVADYLLLASCVLAAFAADAVPTWYVAVFAARFGLFPAAMGLLGLRRRRIEPESTFLGKVAVFAVMTAFAVQLAGSYDIPLLGDPGLVFAVEVATAAVMAVSLAEKLRYVAARWRPD